MSSASRRVLHLPRRNNNMLLLHKHTDTLSLQHPWYIEADLL